MPTNIEYALMAGSAYVSTRSDKNTFPAPIAYGWAEIKSEYVTKPSGFEAVSFTRGTGVNQEIVISYAGTNFSDLTGDWATNVALAAGQWSVQLLQAAEYYMQIKALYPQANITFTGHSLGGGLAAIMSVFFNKDSVTFDQAPFGESVIDADLAIVLRDALITGFPQSEYPQIGEWLASLNLFITSPEYELTNRKSKVTNINVRGEALALSSALRIGTDANTLTLEHGGSADVIELHSQSLLTAFLMNDDFRQLTYKLTALLEMLFNSDLYARPVGGSDENFLERLIRHQEGVVADSERGVTAVAADDMLTRFTDDLTMIAQEGGLTMNENIAKALTAFAMQMYYDDNNPNSTDASKKLFDDDSVTGGVHFKPSDLAAPLETTKGYKLYFKHYLNFLPGAEINLAALTAVEGKLPKLIDWYIQAGTSPMNATAGSDPVFMLGGTGNDTLTGGSDDDVLIGGQGIDHLNGGSGNDLLIGGSDGDIIEGGSGNNTLYGGYSNDHLFGGKDNDVIFGGGGNDVIYAGGGFNSLNDESGHDTYKLVSSGIDTIGDSDGKGSVYLNNVQLIGGKKIRECVYTNGGNTYIWSGIEGTPLIINRSKIISNFHNEKKDLGIYLYEDKDDGGGSGSGGWDGGVGAAGGVTIPCDPLLIDLNGDGIQTSSLTSGTFFDYDGNGFAERMGWASSDDGILVTDRNQDGIINDGSELFGDQTLLSAGKKAANGFQALADLDSNADGKIDANDTAYSNLRIWRDSNSDGYAQESELFTLEDVGISSINLTATAANITDAGGNTQTLSGTFTKTDGTIGEIADYNLQSDSTYSIPAAWVTIPEDIAALPDLQGYGNVYNLQQAMAMDATGELKALVEQFIAEENPATRKAIMEQILFHWTDSEDITKNRGNMDGRQLATLEKFTGENFMGQFGPNPNAPAQVILEQSYQNLLETSYCHLMVQTHLQDLYGKITYAWNETTQTMKADLSAVTAELAARLASDPTQGREDLAEFARSLRGMGIQEMVNYLSFRETFISMDAALGWVIDSANGNRTNDAVYGTAGDETLSNGSDHAAIVADGGNDTVRAGAGNDTIDGGNGNDTLYGEAGSDTYIFRRGDGHDVIIDNDSTAGNVDTIWFGNNISPEEIIVNQSGNDLILKLKDTMDAITVQGYYQSYSTAYRIERIKFIDGAVWHATDIEQQKLMTQTTASDDLMYGTAQDDVLSGLKGNDIIYGLGGHDSLSGNEDNDKLYGGSGSDTLAGGTGDDKLYGEADHDVLLGGDGHDSLYGGAGHDALDGGAGNDVLNGGADDYWHNPAYNGEDTYRFGRGSGQDTIIDRDATPGNLDTILLEPNVTPEDVVLSHRNDDLILSIKDTGDTITVMNWFKNESSEYQVERIEFSDDTVWDAAAIKLILLQGTSGNDALIGYSTDDIIQALAGNDNLYGHAGQDLLDGGAGDDYLFSGAGNDTLDGGAGNDKLYGGSDNLDSANGNDTYLFSRGDGQDTIYDYDTTPGNLDTILLGDDITPDDMTLWRDYDYLTLSINGTTDAIMISDWFNESGAYQVEQIKFADGTIWDVNAVKQMQLQATSGDDKIIGYSTADDIQGLEGGDQLYGRAGDDILDGGAGEDHIYGETGNDVLLGGEDDDVLYGGDGHDTLDGGEGYDILYGGIGGRKYYDKITNLSTGNDTYLFGRGSGQDFIYDYDATSGNLDTILLDSDVTPDDVALSRNNNDLTLTIEDTGDTITVSNWFESDEYQIERIGFADGTVWNVPIISEMLYKGTAGNDVLIGSYAADTIQGLEGDDQLYGRAGDDILDGGAGNDTLYGQTGNDTYLFGRGSGYDVVIDQDNTAGNLDTILLNSDITPGDVTLRRNGDSLIFTINNSAGSITVSNWFSGEAGNNQIERIEFCDGTIWDASAIKQIVIQATPGNDVLIGYSTADDIRGLEGRDRLYGRAGGDTLDGGAGNDQLYGETGNDTYLFGRGFGYDIVIDQDNTAGNLDTILLDPDITPNDVDLKRSGDDLILSINDTNDKITVNNWFLNESNEYQVERIQFADGTVWDAAAVKLLVLQGTSDDDVLIGYSTADSIQGLEGNDQIYGYAGDDTIDGGAGHDEIDGNAGNDELFGGADNDTIYGDAGDDYLDGGHHIQIGCIEYFYKKYSSKSLERGIDRRIFIS